MTACFAEYKNIYFFFRNGKSIQQWGMEIDVGIRKSEQNSVFMYEKVVQKPS